MSYFTLDIHITSRGNKWLFICPKICIILITWNLLTKIVGFYGWTYLEYFFVFFIQYNSINLREHVTPMTQWSKSLGLCYRSHVTVTYKSYTCDRVCRANGLEIEITWIELNKTDQINNVSKQLTLQKTWSDTNLMWYKDVNEIDGKKIISLNFQYCIYYYF
jgi:hypothetical protein